MKRFLQSIMMTGSAQLSNGLNGTSQAVRPPLKFDDSLSTARVPRQNTKVRVPREIRSRLLVRLCGGGSTEVLGFLSTVQLLIFKGKGWRRFAQTHPRRASPRADSFTAHLGARFPGQGFRERCARRAGAKVAEYEDCGVLVFSQRWIVSSQRGMTLDWAGSSCNTAAVLSSRKSWMPSLIRS